MRETRSADMCGRETEGGSPMKIQILGTGCAKCKTLTVNAEKAVQELGLMAEIEKVTGIQDIMKNKIQGFKGGK